AVTRIRTRTAARLSGRPSILRIVGAYPFREALAREQRAVHRNASGRGVGVQLIPRGVTTRAGFAGLSVVAENSVAPHLVQQMAGRDRKRIGVAAQIVPATGAGGVGARGTVLLLHCSILQQAVEPMNAGLDRLRRGVLTHQLPARARRRGARIISAV